VVTGIGVVRDVECVLIAHDRPARRATTDTLKKALRAHGHRPPEPSAIGQSVESGAPTCRAVGDLRAGGATFAT